MKLCNDTIAMGAWSRLLSKGEEIDHSKQLIGSTADEKCENNITHSSFKALSSMTSLSAVASRNVYFHLEEFINQDNTGRVQSNRPDHHPTKKIDIDSKRKKLRSTHHMMRSLANVTDLTILDIPKELIHYEHGKTSDSSAWNQPIPTVHETAVTTLFIDSERMDSMMDNTSLTEHPESEEIIQCKFNFSKDAIPLKMLSSSDFSTPETVKDLQHFDTFASQESKCSHSHVSIEQQMKIINTTNDQIPSPHSHHNNVVAVASIKAIMRWITKLEIANEMRPSIP